MRKDSFVSGSWDKQIKLWSPQSNLSLSTFNLEHTGCIYSTVWSPSRPDTFVSCSGDSTLKTWDARMTTHSTLTIPNAHQGSEILSVDWNKYKQDIIVSVGVDRTIRIWDLKFPSEPLQIIPNAHDYAIRRVKYSPHSADLIATASYDMTWKLWNLFSVAATPFTGIASPAKPSPPQILKGFQPAFVYNKHSEFVIGLDFSLFEAGKIISCSWDRQIHSILV